MEPIKKVSHIGIAVRKIEDVLPFYEGILKLKLLGTEMIKTEHVRVAFLEVGETRIELLQPLNSNSAIQRFIDKRGEGIHHIALETKDLHARIEQMKKEGVTLTNIEPQPGAGGSLQTFIHPGSANGVLMELVEEDKYKSNEE